MYYREQFVFDQGKPRRVVIRSYEPTDFPELIRVQAESFPPPFPSELWWNETQLDEHVTRFPDGALAIVEAEGPQAGMILGSTTALIVAYPLDGSHPSWERITDAGYIRNHNPEGDTLYVVDLCVRPAARGLSLGRVLLESLYHTVLEYRLLRLLGGGRLSGYHRYKATMNPADYLTAILAGTVRDPVISFMLAAGRVPKELVENYLTDEESDNCAVLMQWSNPFRGREKPNASILATEEEFKSGIEG